MMIPKEDAKIGNIHTGNIYTSITASDALSVEDKETALTGLDENMLRARMGKGSSPQPFGYERLRAGTHIAGSIAINTGYRPSQKKEKGKEWEPISKDVDKEHLRALFWYGVYCALTNEGYAQTAKTGQHNTRMRPIHLVAIETFKTPFPSCTRVDYSSTSVEDVISNHASYAKYITSDIGFDTQDVDGWSVLSKNGEERGRIKVMSGDDAYKFLIDQAEKIHTVPKTPTP